MICKRAPQLLPEALRWYVSAGPASTLGLVSPVHSHLHRYRTYQWAGDVTTHTGATKSHDPKQHGMTCRAVNCTKTPLRPVFGLSWTGFGDGAAVFIPSESCGPGRTTGGHQLGHQPLCPPVAFNHFRTKRSSFLELWQHSFVRLHQRRERVRPSVSSTGGSDWLQWLQSRPPSDHEQDKVGPLR